MDIETTDHLLTTTRTVRKRLDLNRPVETETILDCIRIAAQAPSGGDKQSWRFLVVRDPRTRAGLGELFRARGVEYLSNVIPDRDSQPGRQRLTESVQHLIDTIHHVPVLVVVCQIGRPPQGTSAAAYYGSVLPAVWSFMLALRSRGLGSAWTTFHLTYEREAAEILGIPYADVAQVALLPVAHTIGVDFKPAPRSPVESITFADRWGDPVIPVDSR